MPWHMPAAFPTAVVLLLLLLLPDLLLPAAADAQEGLVGPASLLHLLQAQLARSHTQLLLTASPSHRTGRVDDLQQLMTTWAAATPAATQVN